VHSTIGSFADRAEICRKGKFKAAGKSAQAKGSEKRERVTVPSAVFVGERAGVYTRPSKGTRFAFGRKGKNDPRGRRASVGTPERRIARETPSFTGHIHVKEGSNRDGAKCSNRTKGTKRRGNG